MTLLPTVLRCTGPIGIPPSVPISTPPGIVICVAVCIGFASTMPIPLAAPATIGTITIRTIGTIGTVAAVGAGG
jgi:hypothetical protein